MQPIYLYLVTNKITGKKYVGVAKSVGKRWQSHCEADRLGLGKAITKYGAEHFSVKAIACARTYADAAEAEKTLVAQYGTLAPNGYNLTAGGENGKEISSEARQRMSLRKKGRVGHMLGKTHTEASKLKISLAGKGRVATETTRKIWSEQRIGNVHARRTKVYQLSLTGEVVAEFPSVKRASELTGVQRTSIRRCLMKPNYTAGGYRWIEHQEL